MASSPAGTSVINQWMDANMLASRALTHLKSHRNTPSSMAFLSSWILSHQRNQQDCLHHSHHLLLLCLMRTAFNKVLLPKTATYALPHLMRTAFNKVLPQEMTDAMLPCLGRTAAIKVLLDKIAIYALPWQMRRKRRRTRAFSRGNITVLVMTGL